MSRPHLLDALRDMVLLCDGGMGKDYPIPLWRDSHPLTDYHHTGPRPGPVGGVLPLSKPDLSQEESRWRFQSSA